MDPIINPQVIPVTPPPKKGMGQPRCNWLLDAEIKNENVKKEIVLSGRVTGNNPYAASFLEGAVPVHIASALQKIEPQTQAIFPKGPGISKTTDEAIEGYLQAWRKAVEVLKKQYPPPKTDAGSIEPQKQGRPAEGTGVGKEQEPLFAGKPASYWLEQFNDADPKFRAKALEALGNIAQKNKNLIPVLVDSLKDKLVDSLKDKNEEVEIVALKALGSLGPDAKPAMPIIVDLLGDFLKTADLNSWSNSGDVFNVPSIASADTA